MTTGLALGDQSPIDYTYVATRVDYKIQYFQITPSLASRMHVALQRHEKEHPHHFGYVCAELAAGSPKRGSFDGETYRVQVSRRAA